MNYIISDEKLEELQKYYAGNNMDNWIKTLKPVEEVASGEMVYADGIYIAGELLDFILEGYNHREVKIYVESCEKL